MSQNEMLKDNRDELTGLLDKHAFYEWAQQLIDGSDENAKFAFIFFDVENFKLFNVNYGYEKGDELLVAIGEILKKQFYNQLIARFSGDHFVVCTDNLQIVTPIVEVKAKVKSIQRNVNLELKAGVYIFDNTTTDVIRCCDRARMACVSIKKKYDLDYKFYDDELGGTLFRKQYIINSLDEALEKGYIKIFYQPIVRGFTGKVCGWEALVRWISPDKGMVYPDEFISVLEEYRLIHKLDTYVIERVIKEFTLLRQEEREEAVPVSINLSRIDFEAMDIVSYVNDLIAKYHADKRMFKFEVTESVLTNNPRFIQEQITNLRNSGYEVWIDDFGSGYSSLNVLKNFEVDLVKIDMEFLQDFESSKSGKIILMHTVSMLKNLGVNTLAEGVENKEQYDYLKSIGCELLQGYLIGRPMPLEEGIKEIKKNEMAYEDLMDSEFLNRVGIVDVLKQNPLEANERNIMESALPLSIGIVRDKKWKFVYANEGYKSSVKVYGHEDISIAEDMINAKNWNWIQRQQFWDMCRFAKRSGEIGSIEFVENGKVVNMRARHIATDEVTKTDAFMVSIRALSNPLNKDYEQMSMAVSNYIFSFYECIDLFGLDGSYYENLYLTSNTDHVRDINKTAIQIIKSLAKNRVYADDRKRFLKFMDIKTVKERLESEPDGIAVGLFRILVGRDDYCWKTVTIRVINLFGREVLLSCVCLASNDLSYYAKDYKEKKKYEEAIVKLTVGNTGDYAFENILKLIPAGVFWKDKQRRFMGANKMFLDYYGLKSVDSIIGKTDEDMGWHIDPEPFKKDELAVINEGKVITDVMGECIVKGKVRKIVANKQPFIIDGEIVGLIGFFNDVTENEKEKEDLTNLMNTDKLTGLLNRRAYEEILEKYVAQYKKDKTDFAIILVDINKFKKINDFYGHKIGDVVLQAVSEQIKAVTYNNSVAFRIGGDEFALLHQFNSKSEIESIRQELNLKISKIKHIGKTDLKVGVAIGVAYYSEVKDSAALYELVDRRMYDDKNSQQNKG